MQHIRRSAISSLCPRVTGGTDGTAAASWGNVPCVQVLTSADGVLVAPGAANTYVMPAAEPEAELVPETPAAAIAEVGDLMISENHGLPVTMVVSRSGSKIANVSAATVSVSGWSLAV